MEDFSSALSGLILAARAIRSGYHVRPRMGSLSYVSADKRRTLLTIS